MAGGSYLGIVQVLAAIARPPHLKALFPVVTPSDFYGDAVYTGGALRQELFQGWMTLMAHTAKPASSSSPGFDPGKLGELWRHLPLSDPAPVEPGGPAYAPAGDLNLGRVGQVDLNALAVRWFDHWLRGVDNGIDRVPPVRVFALGVNEWREYPDWPPPGTRTRTFFLAPGAAGDIRAGTLS